MSTSAGLDSSRVLSPRLAAGGVDEADGDGRAGERVGLEAPARNL